jgi:imidazole glycerol-phosphate synthase subunit HisH
MNNKIGIVNYGVAGNIHSVKKAIIKSGGDPLVINFPNEIKLTDKLIIPGVGTFKSAMDALKNNKFIDELLDYEKPILGICLGMQILCNLGFENGKTKGLGKFDAEVKPIICNDKVPHMGFAKLKVIKTNKLLNGIEDQEFYFMHSYEVVNYTDIASLSEYSNHSFVSSIMKENIFGVQFHPEKSREAGLKLFSNFINL